MFKNRRPGQPPYPTNRKPNTPRKGKPRGVYAHGQWLCDCIPALPAEHFQVKKEGKNKGRWFYTCQKGEGDRCGFFLWDEDAKLRMEGAVLSGSRTEPAAQAKAKELGRLDGGSGGEDGETRGKKRTLPWTEEGRRKQAQRKTESEQDSNVTVDEGFGVSDGEEELLSQAAQNTPDTPRKAQKTNAFETPSSKTRPLVNSNQGLPTPGTTPRHANTGRLMQQQDTPTPIRTVDKLSDSHEKSLADKVFELLGLFEVGLEAHAASALRGLLESEARRQQGVAKGRDAARAIIGARDQRIAELVERCTRLEGECEAHKALVKHLREK